MFDIAQELMREFDAHNRHQPAKGWIAFPHPWHYQKCRWPENTRLLDIKPWVALAKSMGGRGEEQYGGRLEFTRGTMAACWAISSLAAPGDTIVLVGFDYVVLGRSQPIEQAASPAYQASEGIMDYFGANYRENVRRYGFTDYGIEYPLIQRLANERDVDLVLAQAIWP